MFSYYYYYVLPRELLVCNAVINEMSFFNLLFTTDELDICTFAVCRNSLIFSWQNWSNGIGLDAIDTLSLSSSHSMHSFNGRSS